ncbi:MAG TPA: pyridoxamine 5'-phosphate oxidase [Anaeromyxobacter sp.]|nr:pyridoxamine 5'-phosphate oxidase [Anaeromyxobacter sp.]
MPSSPDPIARFHDSLARAATASTFDATAAALATADASGRPSVRIVLVKTVDARGFAFFTNRDSRKGRELAENPRAALCFHWPAIGEQVRAEGEVSVVEDSESDAYFATRPRESQIGAWASRQSAPLASRAVLEEAARAVAARFADADVPRPPFWGGYLLRPDRIEFWTSAVGRLHHRTLFERAGDGWKTSLLNP